MRYVDIAKQKEGLKKRRTHFVIFLTICAVVWLCVTVLLLLISPFKNYTWYLVADILITILFGSVGVFVFTNPLKDIALNLKWLNRVTTSHEEKEFLCFAGRQKHNYDGIDVDLLTFEDGDGLERSVYCLQEQATDFELGVVYIVVTRANTLVGYEVKHD